MAPTAQRKCPTRSVSKNMLALAFFLASIAFFLQGMGLPGLPMNAFAPWIALTTLSYPFKKEFWKPLALCVLSGVFVDLFSDYPFGVHACSYMFASFLLLRYRNR